MKDPFHLKLKIDLLLYFFPSHRFQIIRFLCNQFGLVVSIACKYSPWCYGSPSRDARATRKWMKTPVEAAKMPCIRSRHGQTRPCRWHNPVSLSSWYTSREKPRSKGVTSVEGESNKASTTMECSRCYAGTLRHRLISMKWFFLSNVLWSTAQRFCSIEPTRDISIFLAFS